MHLKKETAYLFIGLNPPSLNNKCLKCIEKTDGVVSLDKAEGLYDAVVKLESNNGDLEERVNRIREYKGVWTVLPLLVVDD